MDLEHYMRIHDRFSVACLYLISSRSMKDRILKAYTKISDINPDDLPINARRKLSYLNSMIQGKRTGGNEERQSHEILLNQLSDREAQEAGEMIFSIFIDIVESEGGD